MTIHDIHTHKKDNPNSVFNLILKDGSEILPTEFCSVGVHPWYAPKYCENLALALRNMAGCPNVLAIGESGIDKLRGGDMENQIKWLKFHILLSEEFHKPLVIHNVKGIDQLLALKKEFKPREAWIHHGFRGNEHVAKTLTGNGIYVSLGEKWNETAVKQLDANFLLLETDESELTIGQIAERIATVRGTTTEEILNLSTQNIARIVHL